MDEDTNGKNDPITISDKVEILSTDDEKLKAMGEILSTDASRQILKLLFNESMTANQISQKTDLSLPLVIYHLKKMQDANVVKITNVGKNIKSHDMKFYTLDKFAIVIVPPEMSGKVKESKSLFNTFSRIHRFATLGAVSIAAWFSSQFIQNYGQVSNRVREEIPVVEPERVPSTPTMEAPAGEGGGIPIEPPADQAIEEAAPTSTQIPEVFPQITDGISFDIFWSAIVVFSVILAGLIIELAIKHRESKLKIA